MNTSSQMFWLKLFGLLALCQQALCQNNFNYGLSENVLGGGGVGTANLPTTATALGNPIRPVVAVTNAAIPTAGTGFGGTAGGVSPTTAYGGFVGQPARPTIPTAAAFSPAATAALAQTTASGFVAPQTRPLRPTGGIYSGASNIQQTGQAQFGGIGRIGTAATGTGIGINLDTDYEGDYSAIPGVAGVDYPIYSQVPQTSFDCLQQPLPGYYSDIEAQCQVFHICALNRTYSFLCPNGTIFSQEVLVCVWWNQYECATAPSLYANNAYIYDYGERTTSNAVYQNVNANPNGLAGAQTRQQIGTLGTAASGRTAPATGGIYNSANIRTNTQLPISNAGGFVGVDTFAGTAAALPAGNIAQTFPRTNQLNTGQVGQTFPTAIRTNARTSAGTATGTGNTNTAIGYNPIQEKSLPNSNREYLPPRRP